MSMDLTTESSIYLAIIMAFLFWSQVSDLKKIILLFASEFTDNLVTMTADITF
jgi:hypothetical protein